MPTADTSTTPTAMSWTGCRTCSSCMPDSERLDDQGAQDRARDGADAARERRAADDRGRDDRQLGAHAQAD